LKGMVDLVIPRKIGHPLNPEYAICAVTEDGYLVCNEREAAALDPAWLRQAIADEQNEARRRRLLYLSKRPPVPAEGKVAIIADDGVATGLTVLAAIKEVRGRHPAKIVLAVSVIPADVARRLRREVDDIVALDIPARFLGFIGAYYDEFDQVEDDEVIRLLDQFKAKELSYG
jgi:putative phosphoribosyl transferase